MITSTPDNDNIQHQVRPWTDNRNIDEIYFKDNMKNQRFWDLGFTSKLFDLRGESFAQQFVRVVICSGL